MSYKVRAFYYPRHHFFYSLHRGTRPKHFLVDPSGNSNSSCVCGCNDIHTMYLYISTRVSHVHTHGLKVYMHISGFLENKINFSCLKCQSRCKLKVIMSFKRFKC